MLNKIRTACYNASVAFTIEAVNDIQKVNETRGGPANT